MCHHEHVSSRLNLWLEGPASQARSIADLLQVLQANQNSSTSRRTGSFLFASAGNDVLVCSLDRLEPHHQAAKKHSHDGRWPAEEVARKLQHNIQEASHCRATQHRERNTSMHVLDSVSIHVYIYIYTHIYILDVSSTGVTHNVKARGLLYLLDP